MDPQENDQPGVIQPEIQQPQPPQPPVGQTPIENSNGFSEPEPKSSKKIVLIVLGVIVGLSLIAGLFLVFTGGDDSQDISSDDSTQVIEEPSEYFTFSTEKNTYSLGEDDELNQITEFAEDEQYAASTPDNNVILFYKLKKNENEFYVRNQLWKRVDGNDTKIADLNDGSPTVREISPNGQEATYFDSVYNSEQQAFEFELGTINLESGDFKPWYNYGGPLLTGEKWLDDNTLVTSEATCFNCDGPRKGTVWKLERNDSTPKRVVDFAKNNNDLVGNGLFVDVENKIVFKSVTTNANLGVDFNEVKSSITQYFRIDMFDETSEKLYETNGVYSYPVSLSSSSASLIITEADPIKARGNGVDSLEVPKIMTINSKSGKASNIPFQVSQLSEQFANLNSVTISDESKTMYFSVSNPVDDGNSTASNTRLALYSLVVSGGENPIETLYDKTIETADGNNHFTVKLSATKN